jgi:hypothetical protein
MTAMAETPKPKKYIRDFEARFEAAAKRANENLEKPSDP